MNAIVDVDNTLYDFAAPAFQEARKLSDKVKSPDKWAQWDCWEGIEKKELYAMFERIHLRQREFIPFPGARDLLKWLFDHYDRVIIASHRCPESKPALQDWLHYHGLWHTDVEVSNDKTSLFTKEVRLVIDDCPAIIEAAKERCIEVVSLRYPWNRKLDVPLFDSLRGMLKWLEERRREKRYAYLGCSQGE